MLQFAHQKSLAGSGAAAMQYKPIQN